MIPILYEDERLLVVDKPPRTLVVGAPGRTGPTLVDLVSRQIGARVLPVHRLDEDTTGALVLARTPEARRALEDLFRRHAIERVYLAVVARVPSPSAGTIESRLDERGGMVRSVERGGRRAVTHYRLLHRLPQGALVECRLDTGRRNQVRVHMADLGCPIVGDRKYGWRPRGPGGPSRPLLHAWRIAFDPPCGGARLAVEAPVPSAFPSV